jgi:hypothetical protein
MNTPANPTTAATLGNSLPEPILPAADEACAATGAESKNTPAARVWNRVLFDVIRISFVLNIYGLNCC